MRARLPVAIVALACIGAAFVLLPVVALFVRAPWSRLGEALSGVGASMALRLSMEVSLAATAISVIIGVPLAWLLARGEFPGRNLLRAAVVLPILLPPVVGGVGLLAALGRSGLVGRWLHDVLGLQLTFTTAGAVVATTFVSMPLVVLATEAGLRGLDRRYERAAAAMGGSPWYVFRRVTLPMVAPQLAAGAVLTWARALGEFGAVSVVSGHIVGKTETMTLHVEERFQNFDYVGAYAGSVVLAMLAIATLLAMSLFKPKEATG